MSIYLADEEPILMVNVMEPSWQAIFEADLIEVGTPQRVVVEGLPPLCIVRLDDQFCVVNDTCTHGEASLADGFVEGDEIECPWHSGKFCVRDGRAVGMPATDPIRIYETRIIDGQVCIDKT
jgi:nitrite reductase/ring-hydroxylating ferredoxin subunit